VGPGPECRLPGAVFPFPAAGPTGPAPGMPARRGRPGTRRPDGPARNGQKGTDPPPGHGPPGWGSGSWGLWPGEAPRARLQPGEGLLPDTTDDLFLSHPSRVRYSGPRRRTRRPSPGRDDSWPVAGRAFSSPGSYSARRVRAGSRRTARDAGIALAAKAAPRRTAATTPNVKGSRVFRQPGDAGPRRHRLPRSRAQPRRPAAACALGSLLSGAAVKARLPRPLPSPYSSRW
jgi:hypothetical protein